MSRQFTLRLRTDPASVRTTGTWPTLPQAHDHDLIRSLSPSSAAALHACGIDGLQGTLSVLPSRGIGCIRTQLPPGRISVEQTAPRFRCGSTRRPTKRSPASRGLIGGYAFQRFLEGPLARTPGWYGSRTRNSQINGLVLYPVELTTEPAQPSSESNRGTRPAYNHRSGRARRWPSCVSEWKSGCQGRWFTGIPSVRVSRLVPEHGQRALHCGDVDRLTHDEVNGDPVAGAASDRFKHAPKSVETNAGAVNLQCPQQLRELFRDRIVVVCCRLGWRLRIRRFRGRLLASGIPPQAFGRDEYAVRQGLILRRWPHCDRLLDRCHCLWPQFRPPLDTGLGSREVDPALAPAAGSYRWRAPPARASWRSRRADDRSLRRLARRPVSRHPKPERPSPDHIVIVPSPVGQFAGFDVCPAILQEVVDQIGDCGARGLAAGRSWPAGNDWIPLGQIGVEGLLPVPAGPK